MFSSRHSRLLLLLPVALIGGLAFLSSRRPEPLPLDHSPMAPIAISDDGRFVATNKGGQVDIIAVYDRNLRRTTNFRTSDIPGVWLFLRDNKTLVTAGGERISSTPGGSCPVRLWQATTHTEGLEMGRPLRSFGPQRSRGNGIALSPDGKILATGGDGGILLWDVATGRVVVTLAADSYEPNGLSFSSDGKKLAASYMGGGFNASVYDVPSRKRLWAARVATGSSFDVTGCALSPDAKMLALGSQNGQIALFDAVRGTLLRTGKMPVDPTIGNSSLDATRAVAFSPNGATLASGAWSGAAVWNTADASVRYTLEGSGPVAFSGDGRVLATGGGLNARNGVILWKSF